VACHDKLSITEQLIIANVQSRKVTWCVWQVLAHKSRKKRPRNTKISKKIAHSTGDNAYQFQGQRSTVKITRSTDAKTWSASYLQNGKAYELETWCTHVVRRHVSPRSAMTTNVKGQGRDGHKWRMKSPRNTKIDKKVAHPTCNNVHQFQGRKFKIKVTQAD